MIRGYLLIFDSRLRLNYIRLKMNLLRIGSQHILNLFSRFYCEACNIGFLSLYCGLRHSNSFLIIRELQCFSQQSLNELDLKTNAIFVNLYVNYLVKPQQPGFHSAVM